MTVRLDILAVEEVERCMTVWDCSANYAINHILKHGFKFIEKMEAMDKEQGHTPTPRSLKHRPAPTKKSDSTTASRSRQEI
jgi:hypothetical protein